MRATIKTVEPFIPELGQFAFGQPWQQGPADAVTDAVLELLSTLWYHHQGSEQTSPFGNTGYHFDSPKLCVHAYSWNEDEAQPWNLSWRDWRVSWYKYAGRSTSQNRALSSTEIVALLRDAIDAFTHPRERADA